MSHRSHKRRRYSSQNSNSRHPYVLPSHSKIKRHTQPAAYPPNNSPASPDSASSFASKIMVKFL